jgi:integrase
MKFPFTVAAVKAWLTANPSKICWDEAQRNLGAYMTSNGVSFFCQFRVGRIAKKKVLGRLGEISIQAARTMTAEYVVAGKHGRDVLQEKADAQRKALTLSDAFTAYTEALRRRGASPGTLQLHGCNWKLRLAKHGQRPLSSFSRQELRDLHNGWAKFGVTAANNTARMLKSTFNYAIRKMDASDIQMNPATAIEMFAQRNKREMLALADLPIWVREVETLSANRACFFLLILHTGLRRSDCASIRVSDIHFDRGVLHRPEPKGKRAFDFPISNQVRAILERALAAREVIVADSEWLFPATRGGGPYTGANCDERMGVGCHMLRRSFASFCIQAGVDLIYTKSLLNHSTSADVSMNSYIQLSPAKRLEAAQRVADFIETKLMGLSAEPTKLLTDQRETVGEPLAA